MTTTLTNVSEIFEQGNRHLQTKLRYFSKQSGMIVKYIISKLRKYKGKFYESYSTIATELNVSTKTVQRTVKRMQEYEIICVSSQFIDGRRSTNVIRLLPYKPFELIKEVVEVVKEIKSKIVQKVVKPDQKVVNIVTNQNRVQNTGIKMPKRIEIVPEWLNRSYVKQQETEDIRKQRKELEKQLAEFIR
ncbi:Lrp/AsnC family transcriptional regulator [Gottfriedia acidiceleris]|uniref:Lrp/AsnC family transcriptional regulator n=1 Tax=Gottfriedia acidiceleris TaxID=371036 RepID=UPI003000EE6E